MIKTLRRINSNKFEIAVLAVFVFELLFPHYTLAQESQKNSILLPEMVLHAGRTSYVKAASTEANSSVALIVPSKTHDVVATYQVPITAYSSTIDQTDSTPCITANGFNLCTHNKEDVIAANFLPFGTKVRIPEYFGDRIFTVQDRMNARYYYRADIWMKTRDSARSWGIKYTTIEVVE